MYVCNFGRGRAALFVLLIAIALATPAFATLGENVATVQADQAHMRASGRMTKSSAYTMHELQSPNGAVVREFVSPAGMVFWCFLAGTSAARFAPGAGQVL